MYMSAAIWEGLHVSDEIVWYMNKVTEIIGSTVLLPIKLLHYSQSYTKKCKEKREWPCKEISSFNCWIISSILYFYHQFSYSNSPPLPHLRACLQAMWQTVNITCAIALEKYFLLFKVKYGNRWAVSHSSFSSTHCHIVT